MGRGRPAILLLLLLLLSVVAASRPQRRLIHLLHAWWRLVVLGVVVVLEGRLRVVKVAATGRGGSTKKAWTVPTIEHQPSVRIVHPLKLVITRAVLLSVLGVVATILQ